MQALDFLSIGRPITRGPLSLYPLFTPARSGEPYVPGSVATAEGLLVIGEADGGQVPMLDATNRSNAPLLLVEGETFVGGLQNRVLNVTVLLATGVTRIPVSCVEAGRWESDGEMKHSDRRAPRRIRRVKNQSVGQALRMDGSRRSDQSAVWQAVDHTLSDNAVASDTSALHGAFDAFEDRVHMPDREHNSAIDAVAELAGLGPLPGQTGVVVAAGGRCIAADLFDAPKTLATYWRQIVMSNAFDLPSMTAKPPSIDRALRMVRRVLKAQHTAAPGIGLGTEHHWTSDRITAHGLEWDDALVHLSVLANA